MEKRNRVDKYKSTRKRKRKGFMGTPYHSIRANTGNVDDEPQQQQQQHENEGMLSSSLPAEITDVPTCSSHDIEDLPNENIEMEADISTLDVSSRKLTEKEILLDAGDGNNESGVIPCSGYKIIDSDILANILNCCSQCPSCKTANSLTIFQNQKSKRDV